MGVGAGLYMSDVVKKSSRSLAHLLMSSCSFFWTYCVSYSLPSIVQLLTCCSRWLVLCVFVWKVLWSWAWLCLRAAANLRSVSTIQLLPAVASQSWKSPKYLTMKVRNQSKTLNHFHWIPKTSTKNWDCVDTSMGRHSKAYSHLMELVNVTVLLTRCFDTVGWMTGKVFGLWKVLL